MSHFSLTDRAAFLMVAGIALFGVLTANIAAYFIERDQQEDPVAAQLVEILRRLEGIERRLDGEEGLGSAATRLEPTESAPEIH